LRDPRRRFVDVPPVRVLNPAFAVAEALWILVGSDDPWIFDYNRALRRYADDGRLQGAYGPRLRRWQGAVDQLAQVRDLLRRDPDSRQAIVQLFDPGRDHRGYRDVPCTLGYHFLVRGGRLHMYTTMRSQDLWLGFPYDVFTATILQELLAGWLRVELGTYHHRVDSLHLYDKDVALASQLGPAEPSARMARLAVPWESFQDVLANALANRPLDAVSGMWRAFAEILASYRAWGAGDRDEARSRAAAVGGDLGSALERWYQRLDRSKGRVPAGGR
jgi:thymidylate synthase